MAKFIGGDADGRTVSIEHLEWDRIILPTTRLRVWREPTEFMPDGYWSFGTLLYERGADGDYHLASETGEPAPAFGCVFME